jgi:Do/DeqQ family serine protease
LTTGKPFKHPSFHYHRLEEMVGRFRSTISNTIPLMRFSQIARPCIFSVLMLGLLLLNASPGYSHSDSGRRTPLVRAVEKIGPMVVNIYTEEAPSQRRNPFRSFGGGSFGDNVFDRFLKDFIPDFNQQRRSLGSGVLINPEGYILTNEHVIGKAVRIKVTLIDKREFEARLIGADRKSDLAVIKIDSDKPLPFVEMGRSDDLMIGETVLAIGNPFGLQHTVTTGIISALNRSIKSGENTVYQDFIQVDASINPGNSGGPLLNINGSLIGINTAIYQKAEGIGFAIPIENAKRIINDLISYGKVRRGWLGLSVQDMTPELLRYFKMDRARGVLVTRVFPGSPARRAGLKQGDVILKLNNHEISRKLEYQQRAGSYSVGNTITFTVLRDGRKKDIRLKVKAIQGIQVADFTLNWLGLGVQGIDNAAVRKYQLSTRQGVMVNQVTPNSAAGRIGLSPGDVIRQVNQSPVKNQKDFNKAILEAGGRDSALLLVQRGRYGYYVTLEP